MGLVEDGKSLIVPTMPRQLDGRNVVSSARPLLLPPQLKATFSALSGSSWPKQRW